MKFLLNVGAEKAGTTWLYRYFQTHPEFFDVGKELNAVQRDDLVPTFPEIALSFKKDLRKYFSYFQRLNQVSGDFTHYEGSTENVFRLIKDGFMQYDIDIVPVYIMRDPIKRAWSSWNMLGGGNMNLSPAAMFITQNYFQCKYKETIEALDSVFSKPLYFFYESFFKQTNIDTICDNLEIARHTADTSTFINKGQYDLNPPQEFIELFGNTRKNREAVDFIFKRFENVPWNRADYQDIED